MVIGGGITLGGGTAIGDGVSIVGIDVTGIIVWTRYFPVVWRSVGFFLISRCDGGEMYGTTGGMGVLGIQLVNSSWILYISVNYSWWLVAGVSLIEQERKLRAWMILSSAETMGWIR